MSRVFEYQGITYSVISERLRTVRTGDNREYGPNAVPSEYGTTLLIPEQVKNEKGKYYRVTEIGRYSFYGCKNITSAFIPSSIEIIHKYGLAALTKCTSLTFGENSKLKIIEEGGLYDLYESRSIEFTSNCIKSIDDYGLGFSFLMKTLILPSSIKFIGNKTLGGLRGVAAIYYCGIHDQSTNIFRTRDTVQPQTNTSASIYVSSRYLGGDTFAGRAVTGIDDSHCQAQSDICYDICLTIKKSQHLRYSLVVYIFIVS